MTSTDSPVAVTAAELAAVMRTRAAAYRLFSNVLLKELTVEQIDLLRELELPAGEGDEVDEGLHAVRRYLLRAGADPRCDLAVDYARVFLSAGVYDGLTAEPYESAFTSEDHLMYQEARDDAMRIYRAHGFAVDPALHMPEDHLGIELEFVATLAEKSADLLEGGEGSEAELAELASAQQAFVRAHVLNWIDALIAKVDEFAKLPLYPAFMRVVRGYACDDVAFLEELAAALAE